MKKKCYLIATSILLLLMSVRVFAQHDPFLPHLKNGKFYGIDVFINQKIKLSHGFTWKQYYDFEADEVNLTLQKNGFTLGPDSMFTGMVGNKMKSFPYFTGEIYEAFFLKKGFVTDGKVFKDTIKMMSLEATGGLVYWPRMQYPGEEVTGVDLADYPGMEDVKEEGWVFEVFGASTFCANLLTGMTNIHPVIVKKKYKKLPPARTADYPQDAPPANNYAGYPPQQYAPQRPGYGIAAMNDASMIISAYLGGRGNYGYAVGGQVIAVSSCCHESYVQVVECSQSVTTYCQAKPVCNNNVVVPVNHQPTQISTVRNSEPVRIHEPVPAPAVIKNSNGHVEPVGNDAGHNQPGTGGTNQNHNEPGLNPAARTAPPGPQAGGNVQKLAGGGELRNGHYVDQTSRATVDASQARTQSVQQFREQPQTHPGYAANRSNVQGALPQGRTQQEVSHPGYTQTQNTVRSNPSVAARSQEVSHPGYATNSVRVSPNTNYGQAYNNRQQPQAANNGGAQGYANAGYNRPAQQGYSAPQPSRGYSAPQPQARSFSAPQQYQQARPSGGGGGGGFSGGRGSGRR